MLNSNGLLKNSNFLSNNRDKTHSNNKNVGVVIWGNWYIKKFKINKDRYNLGKDQYDPLLQKLNIERNIYGLKKLKKEVYRGVYEEYNEELRDEKYYDVLEKLKKKTNEELREEKYYDVLEKLKQEANERYYKRCNERLTKEQTKCLDVLEKLTFDSKPLISFYKDKIKVKVNWEFSQYMLDFSTKKSARKVLIGVFKDGEYAVKEVVLSQLEIFFKGGKR